MSSATNSQPTQARALANALGDDLDSGANMAQNAMSPRQQWLDHLFAFYECRNYDKCKVDWNGHEVLDHVGHDEVSSGGFIPPGFYDAGQTQAALPLKFRKPTTPYYLGRVIVDRFTSLLFSNHRTPRIVVDGDPDTEDFVNGMIDVCRFWSLMVQARTFGGAMGSVGMGFKIVDGLPVIEVHDPRYSKPEFTDAFSSKVQELDKRYMYSDYLRGEDGKWIEAWFWYRRLIDAESDTVWPKVPVGDGSEPRWEEYKNTSEEHGLGFCPIVWIQNLPVQGNVDGDSDIHGAHDMIRSIDSLLSQAHRGVVRNCDPTALLITDGEMDAVQKGSDNAIKVEKGGNAQYMEITGAGAKIAMELAKDLEEKVLKVVRCYLDTNLGGAAKTATETERNYSSMIEKADMHREQYGEQGIKALLVMMVKAARKLSTPRIERNGEGAATVVRGTFNIPPRVVKEDQTGKASFVPRKLGPSNNIDLKWPDYFHPTLDDAEKSVKTVAMAVASGLLDDEHALQFIAPYLKVDDIPALLEKLRAHKDAADSALEKGMMDRMAAAATGTGTGWQRGG